MRAERSLRQKAMTVLPPPLEQFIRSSFRSVWDVDLLLLLHRDVARTWSGEELVRELRASAHIVAEAIAVLTRAGLAGYRGDGRFGFRAAGAETEALVEALGGACARLPFAVKRIIWETQRERLPPRPDGCC